MAGGAASSASQLSPDRIAGLQAECFAEDVDVPAEATQWSEARLVAYLENGGAEPAGTSAEPLGRPARIACLHGTAGNEKIFRIQLAKLLGALKGEADCHFYAGANTIEPGNPHGHSMHKYFGQNEVLREYAPPLSDADGRRVYEPQAAADAIDDLESKIIASAGGCDVLLGFSQGANFASMLAARRASGLGPLSSPRCLVLLAPARPGWASQPAWRELFASPIELPCLIIGGACDDVAGTGPRELVALFRDARYLEHAEGHRPLPADREGAQVCPPSAVSW